MYIQPTVCMKLHSKRQKIAELCYNSLTFHQSRTKLTTFRTQTVTMSLHISMSYYPPAVQKTLPPMCQKGGPPATFWYVVPCLVTVITAGEMSLVHTFWYGEGMRI